MAVETSTGSRPSYAGRSILEIIWQELDHMMEIIMDADKYDLAEPIDWYRARANGIAYAIAVIQNPYEINLSQVREQAKQRWQDAEPSL